MFYSRLVSVFTHIHRMAHWFHRNPLKATAPVSFNFYGVAGSPAANKICKYVFFFYLRHQQSWLHIIIITAVITVLLINVI